MKKNKRPTLFEQYVGRATLFLVMFAFIVKMELGFIELFTTGHTSNFIWVMNLDSPDFKGSITGFLYLTIIAGAVFRQMVSLGVVLYKLVEIFAKYLAQYEIRRKEVIA